MMHFLYLGPFRFPEGDAAAARVLNNSRLMRDIGYSIDILSFGGNYQGEVNDHDVCYFDSIPYIITYDIDTHSWKERALRYIAPYPNARSYIKENIKKYDVIIVYNTTLPFNLYIQHICNKYKKKLILDLTEWPAANESPGGKFAPFYWMSEYNMRSVQKRFNNIIVISKFSNDFYSGANTLLIPPLVDIREEKWDGNSPVLEERIINHKGIKILFAGTPARKDLLGNLIHGLLKVFQHDLRLQLIVVGVSQVQASDYCEIKMLEKYHNNLVFLGRIPQREVPSYYKIANFSAIIREPSRKNRAGFPTKMAESMTSHCPVFGNITSDLQEYLSDGENAIIIDSYDIDSIVVGLKRMLTLSDNQLSNMKDNAGIVGKKYFDYRVYYSQMAGFIDNLR